MTNPAKGIFEKYAETGFYTPTATEPTIKITVYDAKGSASTGAGGEITYSNGSVAFTYDRATEQWETGSGNKVAIPEYYELATSSTATSIVITGKVPELEQDIGTWTITTTLTGHAIPNARTGEDITDYLKRVCDDVYLTWIDGKAAGRTVYMDSNIALTDGTYSVGSGKAKTIPNLYKAIHDMDTRIDAINVSHGPSTADAGLYVKYIPEAADSYQAFSKVANNGIEISVGDGFSDSGTIDKNATKSQTMTDYNMHFRANEITFTVTNHNMTVGEAYAIFEPNFNEHADVDVDADAIPPVCESLSTINAVLGAYTLDEKKEYIIAKKLGKGEKEDTTFKNDVNSMMTNEALASYITDNKLEAYNAVLGTNASRSTITYYWVPLEDHDTTKYITQITDGVTVNSGAHGKILMNIKLNDDEGLALKALNELTQNNTYRAAAQAVLGVLNKNGTVVYASHAAVKENATITCGPKVDDLQVSGEMTYNLGAIIEAIQELNRRTMFMDTDVSFNGALSYGDYQKNEEGDTIHYGPVLDGLPAATNSTIEQHYGPA